MKAIICGAGRVGYNIARYISQQNVDVTVIDQSKTLISKISDAMDVRPLIGHASDPEVLARAGGEDTDLIVAVSKYDEVNMLACQIGHSLFEIDTKIARIRNPHYLSHEGRKLFSDEHIPIDAVISPEDEVAEHIKRNFTLPGVLEVLPMAGGLVNVIGVRCPENCPVMKTPLRQLTSLFPELPMRVLAIIRNQKFIIPEATEEILQNDEVYFAVATDATLRALDCFNITPKETNCATILGGGRIAQSLAEKLQQCPNIDNITIIEKSRDVAYAAAEKLPYVNVIHGDILDEDILSEANIGKDDIVACVTDNDEANIFGAVLARQRNATTTMAIVSSDTYTNLADTLRIGSIIRPREITTSGILRYIRLGRISSAYSLRDSAEIIEAEVSASSSLAGASLREKKIGGMVAGAIVRDQQTIIPRGDTQFKAGDKVVFIAPNNSVRLAEKLFSAGL